MNEASSPAQLAGALGRNPMAAAASAAFGETIDPVGPPCREPPARVRRPPTDCGDLPFLIRRDGTWLYRGSTIPRKELVCLFASVLKRDTDGSFYLETPAERGRIDVEDAQAATTSRHASIVPSITSWWPSACANGSVADVCSAYGAAANFSRSANCLPGKSDPQGPDNPP